jgi:hypothetical protein
MISAGERPKTYALDRMATGTGSVIYFMCNKFYVLYNKLPFSYSVSKLQKSKVLQENSAYLTTKNSKVLN